MEYFRKRAYRLFLVPVPGVGDFFCCGAFIQRACEILIVFVCSSSLLAGMCYFNTSPSVLPRKTFIIVAQFVLTTVQKLFIDSHDSSLSKKVT